MKRAWLLNVCVVSCLFVPFKNAMSAPFDTSLYLEGLTGSQTVGKFDAVIPFRSQSNSLLFGDFQGKYSFSYESELLGAGLGYRTICNNYLLGGYLFFDYNKSNRHNEYYFLTPGLEAATCQYNLRVNGYVPVNKTRYKEEPFFPSDQNACGIHGNCEFVEFSGHQQFEHLFAETEETGPGFDITIGRDFYPLYSRHPYSITAPLRLQGSYFYYHLADFNDIKGVAARVELPVSLGVSITAEGSYDNSAHAKALVGLQFALGKTNSTCHTLCDRLYDQVYRYRGSLDTGMGPRTDHGNIDQGLFLRRDNIFFFSEAGTAVLGDPNAGTFEHPFRDDQLNDATIASLGADKNLYFNTGSFVIDSLGDGRVTLVDGQALFGRSPNFKCTANGNERPMLLGGIDALDGSFSLDSIRLINTAISPTEPVIALGLFNADMHICNSDLIAQSIAPGSNPLENVAIGILANGSNVLLETSLVLATATVQQDNFNINAASAIGNYNSLPPSFLLLAAIPDNPNFSNNHFTIDRSIIRSTAEVGGNEVGINFATAIGTNAFSETANFSDNTFLISNSLINTLVFVGGDVSPNDEDSFNFAAGIGNNNVNSISSLTNFESNKFDLKNSTILVNNLVGGNLQNRNFASGIGNNIGNLDSDRIFAVANFENNQFALTNSDVAVNLILGGINIRGRNWASAIGNTASDNTTANFVNNVFQMQGTNLATAVEILGDNSRLNFAAGIGNNFADPQATALFENNNFNINESNISVLSFVGGSTDDTGRAIAIRPLGENNLINVSNSTINARAILNGSNTLSNFALAVDANSVSVVNPTVVNLFNTTVNIFAQVGGVNMGTNLAEGFLALGSSQINVADSLVWLTALANSEVNQVITSNGNVYFINTPIIINENP